MNKNDWNSPHFGSQDTFWETFQNSVHYDSAVCLAFRNRHFYCSTCSLCSSMVGYLSDTSSPTKHTYSIYLCSTTPKWFHDKLRRAGSFELKGTFHHFKLSAKLSKRRHLVCIPDLLQPSISQKLTDFHLAAPLPIVKVSYKGKPTSFADLHQVSISEMYWKIVSNRESRRVSHTIDLFKPLLVSLSSVPVEQYPKMLEAPLHPYCFCIKL